MSRRHLFIWLTCAIATILLVGAFNFIVDPYGIFRSVVVKGFNQNKEGARNKIRFVKALELPLRKPATLIMGSSRVWKAMDPGLPLLQEFTPVYNLGVDLSRIHEILVLLRHATANSDVKRVVLGLDFFMFNSLQKVNFDFDETLTGRKVNVVDYFVPAIFSDAAVIDSLKVIRFSIPDPALETFLANGYRPQELHILHPRAPINYENLHYYTNWIFLTPKPQLQNTFYYGKMALDDDVFNDFEAILSLCALQHIDLRLYISPAHAHLEGEGIWALGKWRELENWKRRITNISDRYKVPLIDFSGYNSVTTEPVRSPMKFYSDSSHFTEMVSNWILQRIFSADASVPVDFGVQLTSENIDGHLDMIRNDREKYVNSNKREVQKLLVDYDAIIGGAPLDMNRMKF